MRILLLSDSHGDVFSCRLALERHRDADVIVHLGDGEEDLDDLQTQIGTRLLLRVCGNQLSTGSFPHNLCETLAGKRIYMTHGYRERVKAGPEGLIAAARAAEADIAVFGHTHMQQADYKDGLFLVNPGSIKRAEYALLDINTSGIVPLLQKLR